MSNEAIMKVKAAQDELNRQLSAMGLMNGAYNPKNLSLEIKRGIRQLRELFYEVARNLWVLRKMENYKDFLMYAEKYIGIAESQANFYAQTFEESLKLSLTSGQIDELGPKKIHTLYQIAPPEAVEEYKDKGTILDVSPAQVSIKELKKLLKAYESNTTLQLEETTNRKNQLLEELKELRKENAALRRYKNAQQTGVFDFKAEGVLNKVIVAVMEANRFFELNRLEDAVEKRLAEGKLEIMDMNLHILRGHIVDLVFKEPYDPQNEDVQRIMNDGRFDFSQADDVIIED